MSTGLATNNGVNRLGPLPEAVEKAVITGDLSQLKPHERIAFYQARCEAAGLDPRAQPFQYLSLQGKLTLYATKAATDQLIASNKLTVSILSRGYDQDLGLYAVQCRVAFPDGRTVEDVGCLAVSGLKGDALANAIMKCVTKAKRRTVLSACGLGMLDESELETIPGARVEPAARDDVVIERESDPYPHAITREPRSVHISEIRKFTEAKLTEATDAARNVYLIENRADEFKEIAPQQIANHLVKWLGIDEEALKSSTGRRNNAKVAEALQAAWESDEARMKVEIVRYIHEKYREAAVAAGIELSDPDEDWEEGRE